MGSSAAAIAGGMVAANHLAGSPLSPGWAAPIGSGI
ncbi:MAG: hypothetical protein ACOX37_06915 [Bacillota bacterium]